MDARTIVIRTPTNWPGQSTCFQITGFDRLNFVNELTQAVPQNDRCRILSLSFEVLEGVRVMGCLTVHVPDEQHRYMIGRQLRAVRGVVSINETN